MPLMVGSPMGNDDPGFGPVGEEQTMRHAPNAPVLAPRGPELNTKGWPQETAYRLLMNNLEVAEDWKRLIVYGGRGKAARDWDSYFRIVEMLETLEGDETLVVQSGKPVAHLADPRVGAPRADLELHAGASLEHARALQRTRGEGPHDVRADDGGLMVQHRLPGHRPGDLRDLRHARQDEVRGHAERASHDYRRGSACSPASCRIASRSMAV